MRWSTARRHGHAVYLGASGERREKPVSAARLRDLYAQGQLEAEAAQLARELTAGGSLGSPAAQDAARSGVAAPQGAEAEPEAPGSLVQDMRRRLRAAGMTPRGETP